MLFRSDDEAPTTYHFEAGLLDDGATMVVGQEIPEDRSWGASLGL